LEYLQGFVSLRQEWLQKIKKMTGVLPDKNQKRATPPAVGGADWND
jgi:hypothetical protein